MGPVYANGLCISKAAASTTEESFARGGGAMLTSKLIQRVERSFRRYTKEAGNGIHCRSVNCSKSGTFRLCRVLALSLVKNLRLKCRPHQARRHFEAGATRLVRWVKSDEPTGLLFGGHIGATMELTEKRKCPNQAREDSWQCCWQCVLGMPKSCSAIGDILSLRRPEALSTSRIAVFSSESLSAAYPHDFCVSVKASWRRTVCQGRCKKTV